MKKYLPLLASLLFAVGSYAQTTAPRTIGQSPIDKGTLNVGINVGGGQQANDSQLSFHFTPRLQYFIVKGWSLALDGRYEQEKDSRNRFLGAGLSTRVFFLQSRRLGVFGQAGAVIGQTRNYDDWWYCPVGEIGPPPTQRYIESVDLQAAAGTGLQYSLCRRLSLEAGVERVVFDSRPGSKSGCVIRVNGAWRGNVGVNYRLR